MGIKNSTNYFLNKKSQNNNVKPLNNQDINEKNKSNLIDNKNLNPKTVIKPFQKKNKKKKQNLIKKKN